jgi:hypothetical protein
MRHASRLAFGREAAQFHTLLSFMAVVSVVLWTVVLATLLLRWYLGHVWYRRLRADDSNISSP